MQLKKAIREAKAFGLIGKKPDPSGATYIEERLRDAILALGEAEKRKKQQDGLANLVSEREKCFVRTVPLGEDREGRRLWHFAGDEPRVWVQEHSSSEVCDREVRGGRRRRGEGGPGPGQVSRLLQAGVLLGQGQDGDAQGHVDVVRGGGQPQAGSQGAER